MRTRVWICATGLLLAGTGFAWPGQTERLVKELTSADSPREKRDALRLVRASVLDDQVPLSALLPSLESLTHDGQAEVRIDALSALSALRPESSPWLLAQHDADPRVRAAAADALGQRDPLPASELEALLQYGADPESAVRLAALRGLASSDDPRARRHLLTTLQDPALELRVEALRRLGGSRDRGAERLEALLAAADDSFPELRAAALDALGEERDARAEAALVSALEDDDEAVVLAALRGLSRRAPAVLPAQVAALAASARAELSRAAAGLLRRAARPPAPAVSETRWLPALTETATPGLTEVESAQLLQQLERLLPPGSVLASDALLAWLGHAPRTLCPRIAQLVARTGGPLSGTTLQPLLREPEPARRAAYVRLFAQVSGRERAHLLMLLDDPADEVREAVVDTLADSTYAPTWSALLARLETAHGRQRRALLDTLARGLARPVQPAGFPSARERAQLLAQLLSDLERSDDHSAALALQLLGRLSGERARSAVLGALVESRGGRLIAALRASLDDSSAAARAQRRALSVHAEPSVAATAVVATSLAGDALPLAWLMSQIETAPWPVGPAAAFALTGAALQHDAAFDALALCPLLASKEPITRRNVAWAIRSRARDACLPEAIASLEASRDMVGDLTSLSSLGTGVPHAVVLQDSRLVISWPDASGRIDWPKIVAVGAVNAFREPYARPRSPRIPPGTARR